MDNAFDWVAKNGGLCTESAYPYKAVQGTCSTSCSKTSAVSGHKDVTKNNDAAFVDALAHGPVSVAIEADTKSFQLYKSGIYSDAGCGTTLDHGVLAVGYASDYYIIKNSWDTTWGEAGYIRFGRKVNDVSAGQCGVLSGPPSFPTL
jgi:KDEL-tailed cysteine endopeptidase